LIALSTWPNGERENRQMIATAPKTMTAAK